MKTIIRCRKCWVDVGIQDDKKELEKCPHCGKAETYRHATITKGKASPVTPYGKHYMTKARLYR